MRENARLQRSNEELKEAAKKSVHEQSVQHQQELAGAAPEARDLRRSPPRHAFSPYTCTSPDEMTEPWAALSGRRGVREVAAAKAACARRRERPRPRRRHERGMRSPARPREPAPVLLAAAGVARARRGRGERARTRPHPPDPPPQHTLASQCQPPSLGSRPLPPPPLLTPRLLRTGGLFLRGLPRAPHARRPLARAAAARHVARATHQGRGHLPAGGRDEPRGLAGPRGVVARIDTRN